MTRLLALSFVLSFDSFFVSIALGTLGPGRSSRRNLVLLFALCDGFASLAGCMLSMHFVSHGTNGSECFCPLPSARIWL